MDQLSAGAINLPILARMKKKLGLRVSDNKIPVITNDQVVQSSLPHQLLEMQQFQIKLTSDLVPHMAP